MSKTFNVWKCKEKRLRALAGACFILLSVLSFVFQTQAQVRRPNATPTPVNPAAGQKPTPNRPTPAGPNVPVGQQTPPGNRKPVNSGPGVNQGPTPTRGTPTPTPPPTPTPTPTRTPRQTPTPTPSVTPTPSPTVTASPTSTANSDVTPVLPGPRPSPPGGPSWWLWIVIAIAVLLVGGLLIWGIRYGLSGGKDAAGPPAPAAAPYPQADVRLTPDAAPKLEVDGGDLPSLNINIGLKLKTDPGKQALAKPAED